MLRYSIKTPCCEDAVKLTLASVVAKNIVVRTRCYTQRNSWPEK
jgi:hypothetical protein